MWLLDIFNIYHNTIYIINKIYPFNFDDRF